RRHGPGLSFVAISSTDPDQTLQPWMVWGATPGSFTSAGDPKELGISLPGLFETHAVTVRNLGTAPLVFAERAGQSIGGPDSPVVIATLPTRTDRNGSPMIDTQGVGQVVFGVHHDGADADTAVTYTIHTNDSRHQADLTLQVKRTNYPPPPPRAPCNIDHCPGYVPPPPYPPALGAPSSGPCAQAGCGHEEGFHGLGPACRLNDGCPGYRRADGGNSYPGHLRADGENCVQPECGHEWFTYHDPDFWSGSYCTYMDGCEEFLVGLGTDNCQRPGCQHSLAAHADPDRDLPAPGRRRGHPTLPGGHPGPIDPP
ncbi:hypothetical protein, partial [Streptomyces broussonetiae]|uniref:hypothetical protein n=1 Tax=Streptomyces broussonetiae TaxID=2686304 RepID=UPI0035D8C3E1